MPFDIDTDRSWKREAISGHGDASAEVRDLLEGDYKKLTSINWISNEHQAEKEMKRIIGENIRSIEGLFRSGEPITSGEDAWDKGTHKLQQALIRMLIVASNLSAEDLGK